MSAGYDIRIKQSAWKQALQIYTNAKDVMFEEEHRMTDVSLHIEQGWQGEAVRMYVQEMNHALQEGRYHFALQEIIKMRTMLEYNNREIDKLLKRCERFEDQLTSHYYVGVPAVSDDNTAIINGGYLSGNYSKLELMSDLCEDICDEANSLKVSLNSIMDSCSDLVHNVNACQDEVTEAYNKLCRVNNLKASLNCYSRGLQELEEDINIILKTLSFDSQEMDTVNHEESELSSKQWHTEALLKYGYTQDEIDALIVKGVILNDMDIRNLEMSKETNDVYLTTNKAGMIYDGQVYYIDVPPAPSEGPYFEPVWNTVDVKEITKTEFKWAEGIRKLSLEEIPKDEIRTLDNTYQLQSKYVSSKDPNVKAAAALHIAIGLANFCANSLKHTNINIIFQESGPVRKVTICVGDSQTRMKYINFNYKSDINTYAQQPVGPAQNMASDQAKVIYSIATGEDVSDEKENYTLTGTWDRRHADTSISGYLSYSADGELIYTPLIFSGDKAYVATCGSLGDIKEIKCDFTYLLSMPSKVENDVKEIFELSIRGESNGEKSESINK